MRKHEANYQILERNDACIILRDIGPWDRYMTITNAAESVVASLDVGNRRIFYYDSENEKTELLIKNGQFAGFAPA